MDIAELNTRITLKNYTVAQNGTTGKYTSSLNETYTRWAKVVMNSNSKTLESLSVSFKEVYTITKRYESDKPTDSNTTINLGAKVLTIGGIVIKEISRQRFEEITAYTTQ